MEDFTQLDITRQDMLQVWLKKQGVCQSDIARWLEVGDASVGRWLKAERIPTRRHQQLVELGIPAELLPEPTDITPGPKRKATSVS